MMNLSRSLFLAALSVATVSAVTLSAPNADACIGGPPGARCAPAPAPMADTVRQALEIYNVLDVAEVDPTPGIVGATNRVKEVGGLKCRKTMGFGPRGPRTTASCEFKGRRNNQKIYDALNVAAVNVTPAGLAGSVTHQKAVANLVCESSKPVVPRAKAKYTCTLTEASEETTR
ncbi:MAG: hypothetical protein U1E10_07220 [Bdellovibrionales bacterium]|nr:hypothetical protein [Bdellovibrionales bacterium]